jgi:hypothetical protein
VPRGGCKRLPWSAGGRGRDCAKGVYISRRVEGFLGVDSTAARVGVLSAMELWKRG